MRTTAERRANHAFVVDAKEENWEITNREKRRGNLDTREIPNSWEDKPTATEADKYRYKHKKYRGADL